jgi:glucokinase
VSTRAYAAGIDIGGTNIKAVAVGRDGEILAERRRSTVDDRAALLEIVPQLLAELKCGDAPVGIASPGLASADNRSIRWMRGRMESIEGLDWSAALNRPIAVLNDAHAATLGEAWCGAAVGKRHVVMLTLGTGVGGGVMVDGRLLQGAIGRAGHLGHISLEAAGTPDIVNTPGSLEDFVGDHTVSARSGGKFGTTAELVAAANQCDPVAAQIWSQAVHALACGIVSLINAFDPQCVVLGGGIAKAGAALFDPLKQELDRYEWRPTGEAVPIVPAALGDAAGAIGAARFAALQLQPGDASR